jgi:hypothetical protein
MCANRFFFQVSAGPPKPPKGVERKEVARLDCSSFLSQIVVPCPVYALRIMYRRILANGE